MTDLRFPVPPQAFEVWYRSKHEGRRLTWQCELGTAIVEARIGKRAYNLHLSTLQARRV